MAIEPGIYTGKIQSIALEKINEKIVVQTMVRLDGKGDHKLTLWCDKDVTPQFLVSNYDRTMALLAYACGTPVDTIPSMLAALASGNNLFASFPHSINVTMEQSRDGQYVNAKSARIPAKLDIRNPVNHQLAMSFFSVNTDSEPAGVSNDDIHFENFPESPKKPSQPTGKR